MGDYNDKWFINTRVQTTNLKRWFLWGILLIVFVSLATAGYVNTFYSSIKSYEIQVENPTITVDEAKKTSVSGYVQGTITNNADETIENKYIKFTFYTKNETEMGSEYIEITSLEPQESKTYEVNFKYQNIEKFVVTITDSKD